MYAIKAGNYAVKVGIAALPAKRLPDLQTANFAELTVERAIACATRDTAKSLESSIDGACKQLGLHIRGEWYDLSSLDVVNAYIRDGYTALEII